MSGKIIHKGYFSYIIVGDGVRISGPDCKDRGSDALGNP
jgi:hypothetical protein